MKPLNSARRLFSPGNILLILVVSAVISFFSNGNLVKLSAQKKLAQELKIIHEGDQEEAAVLPTGWKEVATQNSIEKKYEKNTKATVKPTIVLLVSSLEKRDPKVYLQNLIEGTKATLPTLIIEADDSSETDGLYTRIIVGYYYSGSQRIDIRQQISVQDNSVYTITASTDPKESATLEKDVLRIFNIIHNTYIAR